MDAVDHHKTSSNDRNGTEGEENREMIANLLKDGKWREPMAVEIQDIREVA